MTVGIYGIFDHINDECLYIGLSKSIEQRWKQHINQLKRKVHPRKDFVEWYHANGAKSELLVFRVLEECNDDDFTLNTLEIKWFKELSPKYYGYVPTLNGVWTQSEETKSKISESLRKAAQKLAYDKMCKICKTTFIGKSQNAKYCSDACRAERLIKSKGIRKKTTKIEKKCFSCSKVFSGTERTLFCNECKQKKYKIENICLICRNIFKTNKINKIYCSEKCSQKAFKQNNPDWEAPKTSRFEKMNKEDLNRLYTIENRSIDEICEFFGCKERTVYYHLKNFGIPKRSYMEPNTCDTCGVVLKNRTAKNCFEHKFNTTGTKPDSFCLECGKKTFNKTATYCIDHKSIGLRKSAHRQWHVNRGIVKDDCEFC